MTGKIGKATVRVALKNALRQAGYGFPPDVDLDGLIKNRTGWPPLKAWMPSDPWDYFTPATMHALGNVDIANRPILLVCMAAYVVTHRASTKEDQS